jgi:hypothetical protein
MQKLPSEGQDFATIRQDNLLYVDKTEYIYKIIKTKGCLFLYRPRRFGKSLLLGAMAEALKGNRKRFENLWIGNSDYDFKKYPVVKLTITGECDTEEALKDTIITELKIAARVNELTAIEGISPGDILKNMVYSLKTKTGERVAILIDEYDYPILSQISNIPQALKNRKILLDFYSALKTLADDDQLRLLFVTGVTKFAQASIFSVFNNLDDLTFNPEYNGVCGFTMDEFETYFVAYLPSVLEYRKSIGLAEDSVTVEKLREQIKDYYDGYSWDGKNQVYNPFSLIKFLHGKQFEAFWFGSGTPTFLLEFIRRNPREYIQSESQVLSKTSFNAVDVADLELAPLLFQTGYLTVERLIGDGQYQLKGPNVEVDQALNTNVIRFLTGLKDPSITELTARIREALETFDSKALGEAFSRILKWITVQEQPALEGFYHIIIYSVLKALHFKVKSEESEAEGIFDLLIYLPKRAVFVAEFKYEKFKSEPNAENEAKRLELLAEALNLAKAQIEYRRYDARFRDEYPVVKRLAVAIVGKTDVAAEIY